ncbi:kinase-like protein [Hypoxylon sp. FL0543]|nr:kinase-like protein [Hypoxylon sp. FL0543]
MFQIISIILENVFIILYLIFQIISLILGALLRLLQSLIASASYLLFPPSLNPVHSPAVEVREKYRMQQLGAPRPPPDLDDFKTGIQFRRAQFVWHRTRQLFNTKGGGKLRYRRVLGFGGFGMVQLWEILDVAGNPVREIAVKFPLINDRGTLASTTRIEIKWMKTFANCEHFTQLARIGGFTQIERERLYNNPDAEQPIMVMEVVPKGSLYDLIGRINAARDFKVKNPTKVSEHKIGYIPNRLLWRMFLCLMRAVIGMAYPPDLAAQTQGTPYREIIISPDGTPARPSRVIHFDLDPQNVLIGDIDPLMQDSEHDHCPVIKIADFGTMVTWNDDLDEKGKKKLIQRGKRRWLAPEQRDPDRSIRQYIGHPINVWAIGLIMFNLLTLRHPIEGAWGSKVRQIRKSPEELLTVPIDTWGWPLLEDPSGNPLEPFIQSYDWSLRELIAHCLVDEPSRRPYLSDLLRQIEYGIYNAEHNVAPRRSARADADNAACGMGKWDAPQAVETDDYFNKFYYDHLHQPPVPPDPYEDLWNVPLRRF